MSNNNQSNGAPNSNSNQIYTGNLTSGANQGWTLNAASNTYSPLVSATLDGDVVMRVNGREISMSNIVDFIEVMKKRFLILEPKFEQHEHYPALKAAYEHYLMIERMCLGDEDQK